MLCAKASRMIHTVIRIITCSYLLGMYIFVLISRKNHTLYNRVLTITVFVLHVLVSNCYLVMIFFICIIREKFEFTSHTHLWSFANIIVICQLGSVHVVFLSLSYYYRERTELN